MIFVGQKYKFCGYEAGSLLLALSLACCASIVLTYCGSLLTYSMSILTYSTLGSKAVMPLTRPECQGSTEKQDWARCDVCEKWRKIPGDFMTPKVFSCSILDATTCETTEEHWSSSDEVVHTDDNFSDNKKRVTATADKDARVKRNRS